MAPRPLKDVQGKQLSPLALKDLFSYGAASDGQVGEAKVMLGRWACDLAGSPDIIAEFVQILQSPLRRGTKRRAKGNALRRNGAGNKRVRRFLHGAASAREDVTESEEAAEGGGSDEGTENDDAENDAGDENGEESSENDDDGGDVIRNLRDRPCRLAAVTVRQQRPRIESEATTRQRVDAEDHGAAGDRTNANIPVPSMPTDTLSVTAARPIASAKTARAHRAEARRQRHAPLSEERVESDVEDRADARHSVEPVLSGLASEHGHDGATITADTVTALHDSAVDVGTPVTMDDATMDTREEGGVSPTIEGTTVEGSAAPWTEDNAATCTQGDAAMSTNGCATTSDEHHSVLSVPDRPAMDESGTVGANDESVDARTTVSSGDTELFIGQSRGAVVEGSTPGASAAATANGETINGATEGGATAATAIDEMVGARARGGGAAGIPESLTIDGIPAATTNGAASNAQTEGVDEATIVEDSTICPNTPTTTNDGTAGAGTKSGDTASIAEEDRATVARGPTVDITAAATVEDGTVDVGTIADDTTLVMHNNSANDGAAVVATSTAEVSGGGAESERANDNDNRNSSDTEGALEVARQMTLAQLTEALRLAGLKGKEPRVFCIPLTDYSQPPEMDAYAELATSLVRAFELWHDWQPCTSVHERELCIAMHSGNLRFGQYCKSLSPASVVAGIADTAAESVRAHARQQWARIQLAQYIEGRRAEYRATCNVLREHWNGRLRYARKQRESDEAIATLKDQKAKALAAVPSELDSLLPSVPDPLDKAALRRRKTAEAKVHEVERCGQKLFQLVRRYGSGVLLLTEPIMHLGRLYRLKRANYVLLLAQLHHCPGFSNFAGAVTAAYIATLQHRPVVGTGTNEQQPIQRLREITVERSNAALQRAGIASMVTLRMLTGT